MGFYSISNVTTKRNSAQRYAMAKEKQDNAMQDSQVTAYEKLTMGNTSRAGKLPGGPAARNATQPLLQLPNDSVRVSHQATIQKPFVVA